MTKTANAGLFRRFAAVETEMLMNAMPMTPVVDRSIIDVEQPREQRVVVTVANRFGMRLVRVVPQEVR